MKSGFSAIELMLVIALSVILVAAAAPLYGTFYQSTQLNDAAARLKQTFQLARQRSISRYNASAHGVYVDVHSYTLYSGTSYASRTASYDQVTTVDSGLTFSPSYVGSDLSFAIGTGIPSATGTVIINHSADGTRTITIDALGVVR